MLGRARWIFGRVSTIKGRSSHRRSTVSGGVRAAPAEAPAVCRWAAATSALTQSWYCRGSSRPTGISRQNCCWLSRDRSRDTSGATVTVTPLGRKVGKWCLSKQPVLGATGMSKAEPGWFPPGLIPPQIQPTPHCSCYSLADTKMPFKGWFSPFLAFLLSIQWPQQCRAAAAHWISLG